MTDKEASKQERRRRCLLFISQQTKEQTDAVESSNSHFQCTAFSASDLSLRLSIARSL